MDGSERVRAIEWARMRLDVPLAGSHLDEIAVCKLEYCPMNFYNETYSERE